MKLNYQNFSATLKNYKISQNSFISKEFFIPLEQEYGAEYKSAVQTGDVVKEGQIIAASSGNDFETYIHSPVPGKVEGVFPVYAPTGRQKFAIKIKFGGEFSYLGKKIKEKSSDSFTSKEIADCLIKKGVVNTFDVKKILNPGIQIKQKKYKNLVVRLFDEDPFRFTDSLVSKFYADEILQGAKVLSKALDAEKIVFAIANIDCKRENKSVFGEANIPNLKILQVNTNKNSCGTKRDIIRAFKKSGLNKTFDFEITKDDFFIDSSTLYEIYKAVVCDIPSIDRLVHFYGNCLRASCVLDVKIGSPLKDIVNQLGGFEKAPSLIVINGLVYGNSVESLSVPVSKSVKSVEFISKFKFTDSHIYSCVNCGNCREICPSKLSPDVVYSYAVNFKEIPKNVADSADACEGCGLCDAACPARIPLTNAVLWLKDANGVGKKSLKSAEKENSENGEQK